MPPADLRPGMSETSSPKRSSLEPGRAEHVADQVAGRDRGADRRHLGERALGAGDLAALERGQHPVAGEAQREELGRDLAEAVAGLGVARARLVLEQRVRRSGRRASRSPRRRGRSSTRSNISVVSATPQPPSTGPTSLPGVERDVVEEDLVEVRLAGDLAQRADRHALGVHRDDEHRQALVLRDVGVRCGRAAGRTPRAARSWSRPSGPRCATCRRAAGARGSGCPARSEPAAGSEKSWHQTSSAVSIGPRSRCFWSSEPWAISVGPSMPTPMMSKMPGTPARPISWLTTTCWSGPRPAPPYSAGQVTAARPPSARRRCQSRRAATDSAVLAAAVAGASCLCSSSQRAHLGAVLGQLRRVVQVQGRLSPRERRCSAGR